MRLFAPASSGYLVAAGALAAAPAGSRMVAAAWPDAPGAPLMLGLHNGALAVMFPTSASAPGVPALDDWTTAGKSHSGVLLNCTGIARPFTVSV